MREAHRGAQGVRATAFWIAIVVILLFFLFPPIWLFLTSIKTFRDAFAIPPKLFFTPTFANYLNVFATKQIQAFLLNSIIISAVSTAIALLIGVPAAYALARFEFAGKKNLSFFILSVRIAPPIMTLFPLYVVFSRAESHRHPAVRHRHVCRVQSSSCRMDHADLLPRHLRRAEGRRAHRRLL